MVVLAVLLVERAPEGVAEAAVSATASAAPAGEGAESSEPPAQPRTRAGARKAAEASFEAYTVGDYGSFWDGWTAADQEIVSRKDYQRRFKLCPQGAQGIAWVIKKVLVSGNRAVVRAQRLILIEDYTFRYEGGEWRYKLRPEQREPYETKTINQIVAEAKESGNCG
ncbi:hypothetical protein [Acrocarpospora corrugata]|uniref:hypothetical protein n=1 Tax=Acrocarpospora corrugata TaxID=35763 RepID=UPI00147959ED|nr:hypothetical protein [Acrocarpospora corrugata]